jgi:hypothetical protein
LTSARTAGMATTAARTRKSRPRMLDGQGRIEWTMEDSSGRIVGVRLGGLKRGTTRRDKRMVKEGVAKGAVGAVVREHIIVGV